MIHRYAPSITKMINMQFAQKLSRFLENTEEYIQEANPGGYYKEIWLRDTSYILKDQFLSSAKKPQELLEIIHRIWSHQITRQSRKKVIHGRGSPEMKFKSKRLTKNEKIKFEGALPSTIYHKKRVSEIYAINPDIDSTALMISTTAWILNNLLKSSLSMNVKPSSRITNDTIKEAINFTVPRMLKAVDYLLRRDIDDDGLLEQDHNEDWMDTVMRKGKIVYSQACFILALKHLSSLLSEMGMKKESNKISRLANKTIEAVEQNLWFKDEGSYIDIQEEEKHIGGPYRTLTQDVSLYLIAVTENSGEIKKKKPPFHKHALSTLNTIEERIWKEKWPLVTEVELKKTGPWELKPNQYHNHTFWPWSTAIEMLARSRFHQFKHCKILFAKLSSDDHPHQHILYEWINPITDRPEGAHPFRTGVSAARIAVREILGRIQKKQ
jgi:hypothetical protein